MNISALAKDMEQQLNLTQEFFQYTFKVLQNESVLRIEKLPEIYFPHVAGGTVAGGSSLWLRRKHENGLIHEPGMIAALLTLFKHQQKSDPVFFDIGALYGYFSLISASLVDNVSVCAFEMNPDSFSALEANVNANQQGGKSKIRCFNVGLSDKTQLAHKSKIVNFSLNEDPADGEGTALDIMTMDDFCRNIDLQPTIMKIDVEGYQAKIIPGALETISTVKPTILLEFDAPAAMERFGTSNKEVIRPLIELGYTLFWCPDHRDRRSRFTHLPFDDLAARHERNSLALLIQI